MCGIAGSYDLIQNKVGEVDSNDSIHKALDKMNHRGPDFRAVKTFDSCVLGHNRLSILDLSELGNQPMSDASGRYWITFNGEIFNHLDLRKDLENQGIQFRSSSDTEVLLHLLILQGEHALSQLNGFFAFAFYDNEKHTLLAARDRFGEKPLWFFHDSKKLHFASELKALRCFGFPKEIDPISLSMFLQFGYIPAPSSIYKNVCKLEPGELIECKNGTATTKKWFNNGNFTWLEKDPSLNIKYARNLIQDAVNIRTKADVDVGCFLSGGVDSSIVALLASNKKKKLQTFSVAFDDIPFIDETKYAVEVAKHIDSHHEVIRISKKDLQSEIENVWKHLDEPFSDSSSIAVSLLSSKVSKHVKVSLSGDGADEIFGGYNKHTALWRSMYRKNPNSIIPYIAPLINALPTSRQSKLGNRFRQIKKYANGMDLNLKDRYLLWASWADENICELLATQELSIRKGARINQFVSDIIDDNFNSILVADQNLVLANDMLVKVDLMSMMHSLEVRAPFLDHRLVEFVNALPVEYKVNKTSRKILLRDSFAKDLPESVFARPKKGFEVPLEKWLRNELKDVVFDHLNEDKITATSYLKKDVVQKVLRSFYKNGKSDYAHLIYSLLTFEYWFRNQHND